MKIRGRIMNWKFIAAMIFAFEIAILGRILFNLDAALCFSTGLIILGMVVAGVQTGNSISLMNSGMAYVPSYTLAKEDRLVRWRKKLPKEYEIAFILIIVGIEIAALTYILFLF